MPINLACDYCRNNDEKNLFFITLTNVMNRKNSCTKVICSSCAERLGMTLDAILNKRDINDALKEIENDLLEED